MSALRRPRAPSPAPPTTSSSWARGSRGLSCALRLAGAGRHVTVLERETRARRSRRPHRRLGLPVRHRPDRAHHARPHPRRVRGGRRGHGRLARPRARRAALPRVLPRRLAARRALRRRRDGRRDRARHLARRGRGLPALRRLRLEALPLRDARLHRHQHRLPASTCSPRTSRSSSPSAASASSRPRCASTSATRAPSGCSASRRCTPASRRRTRSPSTRSSPTWTPSPASTSRRAACTRCRARMAARRGEARRHDPLLHRGHARRAQRRPRRPRSHRRRRAHPRRRRRAQPRPPRRLPELLGESSRGRYAA